MSLLAVRGLRKSFGAVEAVRGIDFELEAGQVLALIGANGAGKSTLFNLIGGQLRPDGGSVTLAGRRLTGRPAHTLWRHGVGRTFQITATFGSMTVRENLEIVLASAEHRLFGLLRPLAGRFTAAADGVLARLGLLDLADQPCSTLAYGDLKRVDLALALASAPRLLLMDEPTAGMDAADRQTLMTLVSALARERRLAVLFTDHDMAVVFGHADRVLVIDQGLVIADGSPAAVQADPAVRQAYLGVGGRA